MPSVGPAVPAPVAQEHTDVAVGRADAVAVVFAESITASLAEHL